MGNDGGSIPHRSELVKNKAKPQQKDANNIRRAVWSQCALSKNPLEQPVVLCPLGKLFNKDAILEFLLDRASYGEGESVCGYVRSMKDTITLKLVPNPNTQISSTTDTQSTPALFVCPLTQKEMNGSLPFVALATCGCVFSEAALKAVTHSSPSHPPSTASSDILPPSPPQSGSDPESSTSPKTTSTAAKARPTSLCPQCSTPFFPSSSPALLTPPKSASDLAQPSSMISINPPQETQEAALIELNTHRSLLKSLKSSASSSKKRKSTSSTTAPTDASLPTDSKKLKESSSAGGVAVKKGVGKVARELLAAEDRRLKEFEGMTPAVRSLYAPKGGKKEDEFGNGNYMTRGTFTRYA